MNFLQIGQKVSVLQFLFFCFGFFFFYLFIFIIKNKIYIDNSKVQGKDERSFPQNTKPNQIKTRFLHYTRKTTNKGMNKISQEPKSNCLNDIHPF